MTDLIFTDPGIDDFLALSHYAKANGHDQESYIVASAGNVSLEHVGDNLQYLLSLLKAPLLKGYLGSGGFVSEAPPQTAAAVHGENGLAELPVPPGGHKVLGRLENLAQALRELRSPLRVLVLSPLSDAYQFFATYPRLREQIQEVWVMGGTFRTPGNINAYAEFNVYQDPAAFYEFLQWRLKTYVVSLDLTEALEFLLDEFIYGDTPMAAIVKHCIEFYSRFHQQVDGFNGIYCHDIIAVALFLGQISFETEPFKVTAFLENPLEERGRIIWTSDTSSSSYLVKVTDLHALKKLILDSIEALAR
ncbi:MAG: nucleoside hydrolase [Gloeobacterales cyanobacterium]